ncbi:MAG: RNA polymerase sigma factor RpoD/SigA [Prevotella sp.]|nr:RNA polymerase sigma factor RpoD/SigA [Candidatus Equicola faecalis]MDO4819243.1 RNA polymerase sigma factor RpoD/SigA [Prevotella sp.]
MRALKIQKSITNRDNRSLERFLQEIGHEELLTIDEEIELAQRIKKGDKKALDRLVSANLRFVVSVAKQYQNQGLPLEDIINEGNIGLIRAAQKFDETLGFKFISYAVWWIRQSIIQAIAEQSRLVRLPLNQVSNVNKIRKEINRFEMLNERTPSTEELATQANLRESKVEEALRISGRHTSLDAPFSEGENNTLLDVYINSDSPMADDKLVTQSLADEIDRVLDTLNDREQKILRAIYGLDGEEMTFDEIAGIYGLTRERVRQIKDKAIKKLRKGAPKKILKPYLGK